MASTGIMTRSDISIQKLIDFAYRASGKYAEEATPEIVEAGKLALLYINQNLSNKGVNLWRVQQYIFGARSGQRELEMPVGTIDVYNINYNYPIRPEIGEDGAYLASACNPYHPVELAFDTDTETYALNSTTNGYMGANYGTGSAPRIVNIGVLPKGSYVIHVYYEYSNDGVVWTTLQDFGEQALQDGVWQYWQLERTVPAQYVRIREVGGATLSIDELVFASVQQAIPLARMNHDDYYNLPNKNFPGVRSLQYWFDRQAEQPRLWLWPVPQNSFQQFEALLHMQIENVGQLSNSVNVPDRWMPYIQAQLNHDLAMQIPGVDLQRVAYLERIANDRYMDAMAEERDKSPVYFQSNISYYTR